MPKSLMNKKGVSRKTLKLKSKKKTKYNSRSKSKTQKKNKKNSSRKQKGGTNCEYLKVEAMNFPDLKIPEQYALLDTNCKPSVDVPNSTAHPNLTT